MMVNVGEWVLENGGTLLKDAIMAPIKYGLEIGLSIMPDIVGYITLASSAFILLNSMMGRSINGPLGFAGGVIILSTSVLAVV